MKKVFIYGLIDPISNQIKYIGKSTSPKHRYKNHLKLKDKSKKSIWLRSLSDINLKPELFIIDEVNEDNWQFWECHYISLYKSWGFNLTNSTSGGGSKYKHSQEVLDYISNSLKGENNPMFGITMSEETKNKRLKTMFDNGTHPTQMRYKRKHTKETREKMSRDRKGTNYRDKKKQI